MEKGLTVYFITTSKLIFTILKLFGDAVTWREFEFIHTSFLYWNLVPVCGSVGVTEPLRSLN